MMNFAPKQTVADGRIVRLGNLEIYYEEYGAGEPLVLLHGFGGSGQNWYAFKEMLARHYRLILVDLRGHGHSTNPDSRFTHRQAANDVFLLLDELGLHRFSAMGVSTGGMILLHMATSQPSRIDAMVLASATTHFPEQARAIMRRASFDFMPRDVQDMYSECAKRGREQIDQLVRQFNALGDNQEDMNFTGQELSGIKARTLVVHGDRDAFFPVDIPVNLYQSIPNAALWIIPDSGHAAIFDPAIPFTAVALQFLGKSVGMSQP